MRKSRVAVIVGTRPEAIKMAPVLRALAGSRSLEPMTVCTSQHRHMVHQILRSFGIRHYYDLNVMRKSQTLWDLSGRLATKLGRFFDQNPADAVLVQGDTSSALFGGLCAFYHKIPVGHVEAGLRTGNPHFPFPEEMNRTLLGSIATWHFAPTRDAVGRLKNEGVAGTSIYLTGNTVVDALRWMAPRCSDRLLKRLVGAQRARGRLIVVTCHRRESHGAPMRSVAEAIAEIAGRWPEVTIVFPVHPNPAVRLAVMPVLETLPNVILCEPLDYDQFLSCLKHACFVISDSGGVQEEATALGKPVLVLRDETERQEGVKAGALKLVGTNKTRIIRESQRLLTDRRAYQQMCRASNVFGDGEAARRIVNILERSLRA
ncbi:MAG: UDP-N-acetylglucosamine 2-epimerase (non-hydrolyzing) [Verrucomicrobia subdivision 3 bacterium]|nr:UDP-N-acetylglucosamine 2-epimerase (non-hydrolyzing) [Limisphaerales bacterium]